MNRTDTANSVPENRGEKNTTSGTRVAFRGPEAAKRQRKGEREREREREKAGALGCAVLRGGVKRPRHAAATRTRDVPQRQWNTSGTN